MDHGRFPYSAIARRPILKMPGDARIAVWVVPNVEHFPYGRPAMSIIPQMAAMKPDVMNYAWRDYGARVGIWRLMEILERQGFKASAALNAEVCEHYPEIVEEGIRLGWEWIGHGLQNTLIHTGLEPDEERRIIAQALDTIEAKTGTRPRGWLGPALTETDNTLDLLAEAGIEYVLDWANDELPYMMRTTAGPLVAMPCSIETADVPIFLSHGSSGEDFYRMIVDQFDMLYEEGKTRPRILSITLHGFLIGHPFRAKHLERALAYIKQHDQVWIATGAEMLDWYKSAATA